MQKQKCKICSNKTTMIHDERFDIGYYHCEDSEFIFMDESKIVSKEKEKKQYENHNNTIENTGYVNMFNDFIQKCVTPHKKYIKYALDFGCGPGPVLAELLSKEGIKTDIYDKYFFSDKVYEEKTYDLITSTEVFEHLKYPVETLFFLKKHLKKGGFLAIMTQFHTNNAEDFKKWWYRRDPTHICFFTSTTFKKIAQIVDMKLIMTDDKKVVLLKNGSL